MGFKLSMIMGAVLAVVLGGFYWYFSYSQEQMRVLQADNAKLETAVRLNEQTIKVLQEKSAQQARLVNDLQKGLNDANDARIELEKKLRRHDLQTLARENPKLVEDRMNKATARVWRDLESLTGSQPKPLPNSETSPNATPAEPAKKKSTFKKLEDVNVIPTQ